jgi:hypothetical protein
VPVMSFAKASQVSKPQLIVRELGNSRRFCRSTDESTHCRGRRRAASGKLIADEIEKWGKVVNFSGAKPE